MARCQFHVISRTISKKNGCSEKVFYARYWDFEKEKILCTKSINELNFKLGDRSNKKIKSRAKAIAIAQEALDKGLVFSSKDICDISFEDYATQIWDYDTSDYIRRKNQEKAGSISRIYADGQLGWLMREVFPIIPKGLSLQKFTAPIAENIKDKMLNSGRASSSINKVLQAIRTPLREAYRKGLIAFDIADKIQNIATTNKKKGSLSISETMKLEEYLFHASEKGSFDMNRFLFISLAIHTGMREGEIRALKANDIFMSKENDMAYINLRHGYNDKDKLKNTKGKKDRIVPIPHALGRELKDYSSLNPNGYLFFSGSKNGVPVSSQLIAKWFKEALEAIGISSEEQRNRNITFHSLRHGYATFTRDAGCSDDERKSLIGHQSDSMLEHYTKETSDHLRETLSRIEKKLPYRFP